MPHRDPIAKFVDSRHRGIFGEILVDRVDGGILDVLRRGEMRFAGTEIYERNTFCVESGDLVNYRARTRDLDSIDTIAEYCALTGGRCLRLDSL